VSAGKGQAKVQGLRKIVCARQRFSRLLLREVLPNFQRRNEAKFLATRFVLGFFKFSIISFFAGGTLF
jgi:hypothetical protein